MIVRPEQPADIPATRQVNLAAFDTPAEADLVDALRAEARPLVSLVGEVDGEVVGHILLSPVSLGEHTGLHLMGLAPMAVMSSHQRRGIGSALVRAGLQHCRQLGIGAVAVLGHPDYYPRFGFQSSTRFGISSEYDAPPEAFMVLELQAGYLAGRSGVIRFHPAFRGV